MRIEGQKAGVEGHANGVLYFYGILYRARSQYIAVRIHRVNPVSPENWKVSGRVLRKENR